MSGIPDWFINWFNTTLGGGSSSQTTPAADTAVSLTASTFAANDGDTVTFTVAARNSGAGDATGLSINVPLGAGFTVQSAAPAQGTYDPTSGTWTVGDIPPGASATLQITATAVGQGWSVITAAISAETSTDTGVGTNAATVGVALPPPGVSNQAINPVITTDGTSVAPAVNGNFNVEVVSGPVAGDLVTLQQGYQAVYLSGRGAASVVDAGFGDAVLAGNGGNDTIMSAADNDTLQAGSGNNLVVAFAGSALLTASGQHGDNTFFGGSGIVTVQGGAGHDTAVLGSGGGVVNTGVAGGQVWIGPGNTTVNSYGADTIVGGTGAETVNVLSPAGDLAFTGSGTMVFNGGSGASTVVGLTGSVTVNGGSGGGVFIGGTAGNNVLNSGGGTAVMIGGGSGDVLTATGASNDVLVASGGAETLNGAASSGNNAFFGGAGSDCIIGGSGNDAITAGPGNMTLIGGGGTNLFVFNNGAASNAVITDFDTSRDYVHLAGYAQDAAQAALAHATVTAVGTIITLSDQTQITFAGVTNLQGASFV